MKVWLFSRLCFLETWPSEPATTASAENVNIGGEQWKIEIILAVNSIHYLFAPHSFVCSLLSVCCQQISRNRKSWDWCVSTCWNYSHHPITICNSIWNITMAPYNCFYIPDANIISSPRLIRCSKTINSIYFILFNFRSTIFLFQLQQF